MRFWAFIIIILISSPVLAQTIGSLPPAMSVNSTDLIAVVQAGNPTGITRKATVSQFIGGLGGTVTSVAASGGTTGLTFSGSPITTFGTFVLDGILSKTNGGTGTSSPSLVSGTGITIGGSFPNQTVDLTNQIVAGGPIGSSSVVPVITWNAQGQLTTVGTASISAGVSSVSGTINRITSTGGTTPIIDISAAYVGQSSITTLGTISSGVWNGTIIDVAHGGTGTATPSLVQGTNITITGSWPNQTINASGGGGSITLGTSAAANNPQKSGDATTGLFSAAMSTVSVATGGVDEGDFTSTGLSLSQSLTANNYHSYVLTRTPGGTINNYVEIGNMVSVTNDTNNFILSLTCDGPGKTIAITYIVTTFNNQTIGSYYSLSPVSAANTFDANKVAVDALSDGVKTTFLRLRNSGGSGPGACVVRLTDLGGFSTFNATSGTGTQSPVPTNFYPGPAFLGISPNNVGSFNLANWNSTGFPVPAWFTGLPPATASGTINAPFPSLVLIRQNEFGFKYPPIVEFDLSAYNDTTLVPSTQMDIALTKGNAGDAKGTPILSMRDNGLIGIGSTVPRTSLDDSQSTDAVILPIGTTGAEPSPAVNGMIRYNSTPPDIEAYVGNAWIPVTTTGASGVNCSGSPTSSFATINGIVTHC